MKNAFEEYQITDVFDKAVKIYDDIFMVRDLNIGINIKSIGGFILNIKLTSRTKFSKKPVLMILDSVTFLRSCVTFLKSCMFNSDHINIVESTSEITSKNRFNRLGENTDSVKV